MPNVRLGDCLLGFCILTTSKDRYRFVIVHPSGDFYSAGSLEDLSHQHHYSISISHIILIHRYLLSVTCLCNRAATQTITHIPGRLGYENNHAILQSEC